MDGMVKVSVKRRWLPRPVLCNVSLSRVAGACGGGNSLMHWHHVDVVNFEENEAVQLKG